MAETVSARFESRVEAERAAERLRAAGLHDLALTEDGGFAVSVRAPADHRELAEALLDPARATRQVQPGFKDVRPGYVPDPDYGYTEAADDDPRGVAPTRGRFADQLDKLPDEPR